jgi:hypothetical protein
MPPLYDYRVYSPSISYRMVVEAMVSVCFSIGMPSIGSIVAVYNIEDYNTGTNSTRCKTTGIEYMSYRQLVDVSYCRIL